MNDLRMNDLRTVTKFPVLQKLIEKVRNNEEQMKDINLNYDCLNIDDFACNNSASNNNEQRAQQQQTNFGSNNNNVHFDDSNQDEAFIDEDGNIIDNNTGSGMSEDFQNQVFETFDFMTFNYYAGILGEVLRNNDHITTVYLYWDFIQYLTDESRLQFLFAIAGIPKLKHLHMFLGDTELSISVLVQILNSSKGNLETFDLNDVILEGTENDFQKFHSSTGMKRMREQQLQRSNSSSSLCSMSTVRSINSVSSMGSYKGLKKFGIQNMTLPNEMNLNPIMRALSGLRTLEEIQMDHIDVQDKSVSQQAIQALCEMPKLRNLTLDSLELSHNYNKTIVYGVAEGLQSNTTALESLTLSGGIIDDYNLLPIANALKMNNSRTLEKLHLTFNSLGCNSFYVIEDSLKANTNLKVLGLDGNNMIGPYCDVGVANVLKDNCTLREISLTNNNMESCVEIANALADNNTTLERLLLSYNHLDEESGMAIARALRKNKTLKVLTMVNNHIGVPACLEIAKALQENDTLEELYMDWVCPAEMNGDVSIIAETFRHALEHNNCTIRVISLDGMEIQEDALERMNFYLELNKAGRNHLLRNDNCITKKEWVDQLIDMKEDLDTMFYWVRSKPQLLFDLNHDYDREFYIEMPCNKRFKSETGNISLINKVLKNVFLGGK